MSLRKYLSRRTDDINYTNRDCKDNVRCNLNGGMSGSKLQNDQLNIKLGRCKNKDLNNQLYIQYNVQPHIGKNKALNDKPDIELNIQPHIQRGIEKTIVNGKLNIRLNS